MSLIFNKIPNKIVKYEHVYKKWYIISHAKISSDYYYVIKILYNDISYK